MAGGRCVVSEYYPCTFVTVTAEELKVEGEIKTIVLGLEGRVGEFGTVNIIASADGWDEIIVCGFLTCVCVVV